MKWANIIRAFPYTIMLLALLLCHTRVIASHIVGGEVTYQYLGPGTGGNRYQVTLVIYENCVDPNPGAIEGDNPAHLAVFDQARPYRRLRDDSVLFTEAITVPANFNNACITNPPVLCLTRKTFVSEYTLPANAAGYIIAYQRCCRNASIVNIVDAGNTGSTYYCTIPPAPVLNNSAVFTNYPPQIICLNTPLVYDNSATDADGDSLSYEFCNALTGGEDHPDDPVPDSPPYDSVKWVPAYSPAHPLTGFPPIQIDAATGRITGTPNRIGRYLVTVCCHEWRNGVMINTIKREFQFRVTDCSRAVVACMPQYTPDPNVYIVDCKDFTVRFDNCSTGGATWLWDFGVPGRNDDTSGAFQPTYVYPDTGTYTVRLVVNPGTICTDSITRLVKIYPVFHAAFTIDGIQCPGYPVSFTDRSSSYIKPVTSWLWYFGDGDSSFAQNPVHTYAYGGAYSVILAAENIKHCTDTALRQVLVEEFKPFAGNDTMIVKGERILFNAAGGVAYNWWPPLNLSDTGIYNPTGYFPDTGIFTYAVHVRSAFGCAGDDTIRVNVIGQAEFFVPTAFSPNGDGVNDYFRPVAIGYRQLNYFNVFNRWGERVFTSQNLETGWDGTYSNHQCDVGAYYWEISYTDRFGGKGFMKGDVSLIR